MAGAQGGAEEDGVTYEDTDLPPQGVEGMRDNPTRGVPSGRRQKESWPAATSQAKKAEPSATS